MVSRTQKSDRPAWLDRWREPRLDQLLEPLKHHQRKPFETLIQELDALEGVNRRFTWFGASWRWTIEYRDQTEPHRPVCFMVPDIESPKVCVPLKDPDLEHLPLARLGKFIREGITSAKCALSTRWAIWNVTSKAEVGMVCDLVRRMVHGEDAEAEAKPGSKGKGSKAAEAA